MKLGEYLFKIRKEKDKTLFDVQKDTGISAMYISEIENNKKVPINGIKLKVLSEYYGLNYSEIFYLAVNTHFLNNIADTDNEDTPKLAVARSLIETELTDDQFERIEKILRETNKK